MAIHLYKDAQLTDEVSEGDLSNPDDDEFNGTEGESKEKELFLANEQTNLSKAVSADDTQIELGVPCFSDDECIIIDLEQMKITGGGGTKQLTVERGYSGTLPSAHGISQKVYSAYDYKNLVIEIQDQEGASDTGWMRLAKTEAELDTAVPGSSLILGDKQYNASLSFWRRCTVPPGTPVQNKTDIRLKITGTQHPIA